MGKASSASLLLPFADGEREKEIEREREKDSHSSVLQGVKAKETKRNETLDEPSSNRRRRLTGGTENEFI